MRVIPDFKDGQPYFVAKDVAEALGYGRDAAAPRKVISNIVANHCPNRIQITRKDVSYETQDTFGKAPSLNIIPESDLYRLVMRSNLPSAQAFQDWVCGTVLPAIRKDGAYIMGEEKGINGK
ncbi:BRO-N domain-containing protein [Shewanella chilikensis]|uniref:BRO-N domain-containing protein n=1 Tax=Shewanella chilikensis TaxID=558541 RepID=UPI000C33324F|nr:BRO family protein [Shewanella chilikensis]